MLKNPTQQNLRRTLSLIEYTDLIEYTNVGDIMSQMLCSFPNVSMLIAENNITTGEYKHSQKKYAIQTASQKLFPKNTFRFECHELWKITLFPVIIIWLSFMLEKASKIPCSQKLFNMVASRQIKIPFYRSIGRQRRNEIGLERLLKLVWEPQFLF